MEVSKCIYVCTFALQYILIKHFHSECCFHKLHKEFTFIHIQQFFFSLLYLSFIAVYASLWCLMMSLNGLWFYDLLKVFPFPFNFSLKFLYDILPLSNFHATTLAPLKHKKYTNSFLQ